MRGDIAARTTYYHNARNDGWMSSNDIRGLRGYEPYSKEGTGRRYLRSKRKYDSVVSNTAELTKGRTKRKGNTMKFWNFKAKDKDTGELMLYGDISSSTWWGDEVTPKDFKKDLDGLGDIKNLNIYINSGGGDVFAGTSSYKLKKAYSP